MNLDALKGKIISVWLAGVEDRTISGTLTAVTEQAIEIRCDPDPALKEGVATVWQVVRSDIVAVGCNEGQ